MPSLAVPLSTSTAGFKRADRAFGLRIRRVIRSSGRPVVVRAMKGDDNDGKGLNVSGEYCSIDSQGKRIRGRTLGEMEQEFIGAMQSWYFDGKPSLTDEEFDQLKEELIWQGSELAFLSTEEQEFLEASRAYGRGEPILTDDDYDDLKTKLKQTGSFVTSQGPRCSLRSKKMYSDCAPDYPRMTLLNLPAVLVVLGAVFTADYITGFKLTKAVELPEPYGIIFVWGLLLPTLYVLASSITNLVLRDGIILKGVCPECGESNMTYFGDILNIKGSRTVNTLACRSCSADLEFSAKRREIVVVKTAAEKEEEKRIKAEKKAAAAAKKKARLAAAAAKKK